MPYNVHKILDQMEIPEGCRWDGGRWVQPEDVGDVSPERRRFLQAAAARREIIASARELVKRTLEFREAERAMSAARKRMLNALGPLEYMDGLPFEEIIDCGELSLPFRIDGHLIRLDKGDLVVEKLNSLD